MKWITSAIWFRVFCVFVFLLNNVFMFNFYLLTGQVWWKRFRRFTWSTWARGSARCLLLFHFQDDKLVILNEDICFFVPAYFFPSLLLFRVFQVTSAHLDWMALRDPRQVDTQDNFASQFKWKGNVMPVCYSQGKKGERGLPGPRGPLGFQVRLFIQSPKCSLLSLCARFFRAPFWEQLFLYLHVCPCMDSVS